MPPAAPSTSCQRCRKKKVKCDETKPACNNCVDAGSICSGSGPQLRWSRKHEKYPAPGRRKEPLTSTLTTNLPPNPMTRRPQMRQPHQDRRQQQPQFQEQFQEVNNNNMDLLDHTSLQEHQVSPNSNTDTSMGDNSGSKMTSPILSSNTSFSMTSPSNTFYYGSEDYFRDPFSCDMNMPLSDLQFHLAQMPVDFLPATPRTNSAGQFPQVPITIPPSPPKRSAGTDRQRVTSEPRSLLGAFYRLQMPTSVPHFSEDHLIRHYFDVVCSLFSCYDSELNAFRTSVSKLWTSSNTINLTIQSMAIAHLANHYRYMAPLGRRKLGMAWKSFQLDLQMYRRSKKQLEELMINLLLLGLSASWHSPSVLELQFLLIARNLMQQYLQDPSHEVHQMSPESEKFIGDSMIHWELLASFVDPTPMTGFPGFGSSLPMMPDELETRLPHPWTGVITELHFALAEVGRVVRRNRSALSKMHKFNNTPQYLDDKVWIRSLERFLYMLKVPGVNAVSDYNDANTPKIDLVRAAKSQRLFGLLETYNAFPDLLDERLDNQDALVDALELNDFNPFDRGVWLGTHDHAMWKSVVAMRALSHVEVVSISSGACRLQPLLLMSCASYLHFVDESDSSDEKLQEYQEAIYEARCFVEARLLALSRRYPQRPVSRLLDIVKEQWQRWTEDNSTHWIEIVLEKGFQMVG